MKSDPTLVCMSGASTYKDDTHKHIQASTRGCTESPHFTSVVGTSQDLAVFDALADLGIPKHYRFVSRTRPYVDTVARPLQLEHRLLVPMQHGVVDTIPVNLYGSSSKAQNQQHQHKQHQQKMGQTSQRKISLSCPADAQNLPEGSNLNESTWYHPRVRCRQHSWLLPLPLRSWHAQRGERP